jgi:hypothetical protein
LTIHISKSVSKKITLLFGREGKDSNPTLPRLQDLKNEGLAKAFIRGSREHLLGKFDLKFQFCQEFKAKKTFLS